MNLPNLSALDVSGKRVIVRGDLDVSKGDNYRLKSLVETLNYLVEKQAKIIIIGHKGRPGGIVDENLSLKPLAPIIGGLINAEVIFEGVGAVVLKENLRFNPGEEANSEEYAKQLAGLGDFYPEGASFAYVNEAFADSHRAHASIVGIPKFLPHAAGFHFSKEIENLSRVFENPQRPVIAIISGVKEDKVEMIEAIKARVDKVLIGGRLPDYLGEHYNDEKILVAKLNPDKEDITIRSIEAFEEEIAKAGTIVLAGVPGKYEDEGHRLGTERIFRAVSDSMAYKVVGGGDSLAVVSMLGLNGKFDWISTGGGAMLEFLAKGTLPGIEALLH